MQASLFYWRLIALYPTDINLILESFIILRYLINLTIKLLICSQNAKNKPMLPWLNAPTHTVILSNYNLIKLIAPWGKWYLPINHPIQELHLANFNEINNQNNMKRNNWWKCMLVRMDMVLLLIFHLGFMIRMGNKL